MMFVETSEEVNRFCEAFAAQDSLVIPVFSDLKTHAAVNSLSLLYVSFASGDRYVLPFRHNEAIPLSRSVLARLHTSQTVYSPDAKALRHVMDASSVVDVQGIAYFATGQIVDPTKYYPHAQKAFYNQQFRFMNLNTATPIMLLVEYLDAYATELWSIIREHGELRHTDAFKFHNNIVLPACHFMEAGGIHVEEAAFLEKYGDKARKFMSNGLIYTEYNPYTLAGRVSNKHGGISFTSLNKHDGTREMFTSRFERGRMIMMDFESFHLRLMSQLTGFVLPSGSLHEHFGKMYFGVDELTPEQYDESKRKTFALLYGDEQATDIPFFQSVQSYIRSVWHDALEMGYFVSPTGRQIYLDRMESPSPAKLFNYMLQLREMEVGMSGIYQLINVFAGKNSKVTLYTYDSILIDYDLEDGKELLTETVRVLEQGGQYPVRIYAGANYHNLRNITDKVKS